MLGKRHTYLHRDPLQQRVLLDLGDVPHRQANLQDDTAANHYQFRGSPRTAPAGECHGMYYHWPQNASQKAAKPTHPLVPVTLSVILER